MSIEGIGSTYTAESEAFIYVCVKLPCSFIFGFQSVRFV